MPSSMTHNYFANDVYDKLKKDIKEKLGDNKKDLMVFGQGPDPYFFYDFHLSPKSKRVFEINRDMQHSKVNEHFISLINYINEKGYYNNSMILSYLYGQICHFALDSTAHSYIIYYGGRYDSKDKETYRYNGLHEKIEYYIDIYMINKREGVPPRKYRVYKNIFNVSKFNEELNDVIDYTVKKVYGYDDVSKIYYKSIRDMKKFYYVFNYDRYGIKKCVYSIMDLVCGNKMVKKKELSFCVDPNSHIEYLNLDKKIWNHPCDIMEKYNYSFFELYEMAEKKAVNIIEEVDNMLKKKIIDNKKLESLFGNLDYGTGKDCNLNLQFKYLRLEDNY